MTSSSCSAPWLNKFEADFKLANFFDKSNIVLLLDVFLDIGTEVAGCKGGNFAS